MLDDLYIDLFTTWREAAANSICGPDIAWIAMGQPKVWEYFFGLAADAPSNHDWSLWNYHDLHGLPQPEDVPNHKLRRVRDTVTGEVWPSVAIAAEALGAHKMTLYAHLRRDPSYKSIKGRTLEYLTPVNALDLSTPEKREEWRALCRKHGFKSQV